jgi:membrane-bound lytic murein transglycosylase D
MIKNALVLSTLFLLSLTLTAQEDSTLYIENEPVIIDSTAQSVAITLDVDSMADALDELRKPTIDSSVYRTRESIYKSVMPRAEVAALSDSVFMVRLEKLNVNSPFRIEYNRHVRYHINSYLGTNHQLTARVLGLSELYFPMFEEALDREGLPLELKYLAIIESALLPTARSHAGATGLWQFMYGTAKENGLRITSYIDERKSPRASTDAACKYLKRLYNMYDDWNLALAAYNSGPGNVNKAIRRAGGKKDYWAIWAHLPRETRGYVPAFIAVNYAMNYHEEHGIFPIAPDFRYSECDTLMVNGPMNFANISEYTGTDLDVLRRLNPQYHKDYIPKSDTGFELMLPIADVGEFVMHEDDIRAYKPFKVMPTVEVQSYSAASRSEYYSTEGLVKESYTVRSGDVIGVIADRYNVGLSKLRYWNNISGSRIYPGQKLAIYRKPGQPSIANNDVTPSSASGPSIIIDPSARYHTIRPGDTLWDIAKLYEGVTVTQIKTWNSHLNFKLLKPGQKVRVSG